MLSFHILMNAQEIHQSFQDKIASVLALKDTAKSIADKRRRDLKAYAKRKEGTLEAEDRIITRLNMMYRDPVTAENVFFGRIQRDVEGELEILDLQQNKQYQWLLAEAYEAFEDFLEYLYASAGVSDADFWDASHMKGSESAKPDWGWLLDRAVLRVEAEDILKQFRKKLPLYLKLEVNNALDLDLRFNFEVIAQMRHHIVHTRGAVSNRPAFAKKILDKIGRWNNGKPSSYRDEVEDLFFLPPHENIIALLERPMKTDHGLPLQMDVMQNFCRALLSTAHALTHALIDYQDSARQKKK